jgi:hypothetical protein
MIDDMISPKKSGPARPVRTKIPTEPSQAKIEDRPIEAAYIDPTEAKSAQEPEDITEELDNTKPKSKRHPHLWPVGWSKKKKRLFTGLLVLLALALIAGGVFWYRQHHHKKAAVIVKPAVAVVAKPTTEASRLTGIQVDPALNQRSVTGVMIENSPDARPQSGLLDAGVVYEAIAEGGITRFLALFEETSPAYVGPIRSARPYYLDWLLPYDANYAHVGGSAEALQQIKDLKIKDLEQFVNGGSYDRVTSRYAPHNVYTSIDRLYTLAQSKGYNSSNFTGFARKPKETPAATPTVKTIDLSISGVLYNPHYDYDAATNTYKRSEGGKPHIDEKSGTQLAPKVVIALVVTNSLEADGIHNVYGTTGSGTMYVFQDGIYTQGTWTKTSQSSQLTFADSNGQVLKLNPGQTWISAVSSTSAVVYKP